MIRIGVSLPIPDPLSSPAWWDEPDVIFYLYAGLSAVCVAIILGVIVAALFRRGRCR